MRQIVGMILNIFSVNQYFFSVLLSWTGFLSDMSKSYDFNFLFLSFVSTIRVSPLDIPYREGSVWFDFKTDVKASTNQKKQIKEAKSDDEEDLEYAHGVPKKHIDVLEKREIVNKVEALSPKNLRRRAEDILFSSKFIVKHSIISPDQHGFQQLPAPVQISVVLLVIGLVFSVLTAARRNRLYIRKIRTA